MITKQEALDAGISEKMWDESLANNYVLVRLKPHIHWERGRVRDTRRALIQAPIEDLVSSITNPPHTEGISNAVDEIMEKLDAFVGD